MAITGIISNTLKNIQDYISLDAFIEDETQEITSNHWILSVDRMIEALCSQEHNHE